MKKLLILSALLISAGTLQAQNTQQRLDSLLKCLQTTPKDTTRANILNSVGDIYLEQGEYPKALETFLQASKIGHKEFVSLCGIGVVYLYQGDYQMSLDYLFKSLKYKDDEVYTLSAIGDAYQFQKEYPLARTYYNKVLVCAKKQNKNVAGTINAIGTIFEYEGQNDSALVYYFKALKLAENDSTQSERLCDIYGGIGEIYLKQNEYAEAIKYQNKSLELAHKIGYLISIKQIEDALSRIYEAMGDKAKAYEHYKKFIAMRDSLINEEATKKTVKAEMNFKFEKEKELAKAEQDKKDAVKAQQLQNQRNIRNGFIGGFALVLIFSAFVFNRWRVTRRQKVIIEKQKHLVEEKKKEMTDNINYASRIQRAILPSDDFMKNPMLFPENFIINRPKDIVSGDFYWAYNYDNEYYVATADCTGHGVSGAMLTMIGSSLLNEIVIQRKITQPDLVLNTLRDEIIKALNQEGASEERKDGMDISFCKITYDISSSLGISTSTYKLECASANNNIYIVRNGEVIDIKADRMPVGKYIGDMKPFTLNKMDLQKGDMVYTLSDGFCDQFGGERGKKLMTKRFKEWAVELSCLDSEQIKAGLENRFDAWIGEGEQIDDVTILALKV